MLQSGLDYSPEAAFRAVDVRQQGILRYEDVRDFLQGYPLPPRYPDSPFVSHPEVVAVIRRLDTNSDFAVDMIEMKAFLAPACPTASPAKPSPKVSEKKDPAPKVAKPSPKVVEKKEAKVEKAAKVAEPKEEVKEVVKEVHHHHHHHCDYAASYSPAYPYLYAGRYYLGRWFADRYYPRSIYDTDLYSYPRYVYDRDYYYPRHVYDHDFYPRYLPYWRV